MCICIYHLAVSYYTIRLLTMYVILISLILFPLPFLFFLFSPLFPLSHPFRLPPYAVFAKGSTCPKYDPTGNYMKEKKLSEGVHIPGKS